jgi:hypothetical protein
MHFPRLFGKLVAIGLERRLGPLDDSICELSVAILVWRVRWLTAVRWKGANAGS